jgi:predicted N-acetyltransferase YhbS
MTHGLWADGLDRSAYRDAIATQMSGDWSRSGGYRFLVLVDETEPGPLGCLKLYRFRARLSGEEIAVGGIGAVFTPLERRGRGIASAMLSRAHAIMKERGDAVSLLFSEIGAAYYARAGYRELPAHHVRIEVPAGGEPPVGVTRMGRDAIETVAAIRDAEDRGAGFTLLRDPEYWRFILSRASYPTLFLGPDAWESRVMMSGRNGYLWSQFGGAHDGARARILELGEIEPGHTLPGLLDEFFAECRRRRIGTAEARLTPAQLRRDPRVGALASPVEPPAAVTMWLPLGTDRDESLEVQERSVAFHLTDLF